MLKFRSSLEDGDPKLLPIVKVERQGDHSISVPGNLGRYVQTQLRERGFTQGIWVVKMRGANLAGASGGRKFFTVRGVYNYSVLDVIAQPGNRGTCRRLEVDVPDEHYSPQVVMASFRPEPKMQVGSAEQGMVIYSTGEVINADKRVPASVLGRGMRSGFKQVEAFANKEAEKTFKFWRKRENILALFDALLDSEKIRKDTVSMEVLDSAIARVWGANLSKMGLNGLKVLLVEEQELFVASNSFNLFQLTIEGWLLLEERRKLREAHTEQRIAQRRENLEAELRRTEARIAAFEESTLRRREELNSYLDSLRRQAREFR
ncbi:MAG TPA: hypothetical protein VLA04_05000 [Verrucomicrobiae bacterium]|nr:hypothetical protein [Verrucomicrobiae bacterium]